MKCYEGIETNDGTDAVRVIITEWALQAYLDLLGRNVFSAADYWAGRQTA